ncbi:MAG TPA: metal ABC transporter substrate-binding protein [Gaiellaceae bacterium]|nr:metal ABC transporter substrate-binding protein [Gaiellaceae bacterium]
MRLLGLVVAVVALAGAAGCRGDGRGGGRELVAAFYPLAWAAQQVAGPGARVTDLTPAGAEPHDLELSPRDVERVQDADLVVYAGGGFQPAVEEAVAGRAGPSYDVARGAADPHVWLDPLRFAAVVEELAERLGRAGSAYGVVRRLRRLHGEYRRGLARCERRTIVTVHAAFGHLARRYGLVQLALAGRAPEAEPGPRELERLVRAIQDAGATTVFAEPLVSDRLARTVAREAGARVAVLDPLEGLSEERRAAGADYVSVMRDNLAALREALGCR